MWSTAGPIPLMDEPPTAILLTDHEQTRSLLTVKGMTNQAERWALRFVTYSLPGRCPLKVWILEKRVDPEALFSQSTL
jgi:hypothetical protein